MITGTVVDEPRKAAFQVLTKAEEGGRINDVLDQTLSSVTFTDQERRFTTELVMGTTRMRGRLDADLDACYRGRYAHIERGVKQLLRLGAYQLRYMDSVPPHAALSTTVELTRAVNLTRAAGLVNGVLRELSRQSPPDVLPAEVSTGELATAFSHPTWLVERWLDRWGRDRTIALMEWNNRRPTIWFRQRRGKAARQRLAEITAAKNISFQPHPVMADYVSAAPSPGPLLKPQVVKEGLFIVQDPSSGAVVEAVDPRPGEVIVDLCAGPGGKTAALAECVVPKGRILAFEINHDRVDLINSTLNRLGLDNVDIYPGDATTQTIPEVDKILVDVPCSGTGVLARRADLRWRRQPEHLEEMTSLQLSLLGHAAKYLRPGGMLVYATCSLEPEENWEIVRVFQQGHPEFCVVPMPEGVPQAWIDAEGALNTFPPDNQVDGLFAVRLQLL
ncbi:MAG: 16S rRNA (cytosine(967)-C(5))-methyltransferase RsmB [Fidelibacterota bacterium]|nr:MAG: 16S rRNA (cytosine(967)-C(5))-methyltransferase RsmB [Candidatus Neomarinimicrobiota bacterium]